MTGANYHLKEEIRDYWSGRAATFDASPGHKIRSEAERQAWADLLGEALGPATGGRVLELGSGTGEISSVLLALGCDVTGLDFAEPMLARARAKHAGNPRVRFFAADAETTLEPDGTFDAVVTRHLVWTLVDPLAAFHDWHRVLKPDGRLVIIDGDWVNPSWPTRLQRRVAALLGRFNPTVRRPGDHDTHRRILEQVYFRDGLRRESLESMLAEAGFAPLRSLPVRRIRRHQRRHASWAERLAMASGYDHEFAFVATKATQARWD